MKQTTYEHIRQMDLTQNGGMMNATLGEGLATINHPVLVIGLGGTGTDALLRVKTQVSRCFQLPENPLTKTRKQKPDNIGYLAFETNEHDQKKYQGLGLDSNQELVVLSNAGIGAILGNRSTLPDYIKSWLAPELTISDGTKGASGNRQAGRLLLFEKINTAIDAIDNKIRELRVERENKLLVYILSGLSGGTGGGMFLDIAYIVRGLMERDYGAKGIDRVEISGYLFTPDVHIAGNALNIHTEEYIQRNGYAALKELDYWMNVEERAGDRFTQRYGTRLTVNNPLPPFNLCHLVSATNIDGVYLKNAYDHCLDVTAENIVNFLAQEEKSTGQEFAIHDYQSNLLSNIAAMKSSLPPEADHSANFVYNIIGASTATLPTAEIKAYMAYRLFTELEGMFDVFPEQRDIKEFCLKAKLDINEQENELFRRLPPIKLDYAETDFYNHHNVIKTRRVNVDEKLNELYQQAKTSLGNGQNEADALCNNMKNLLASYFTHPRLGPFFAARFIKSDVNPDLITWLDEHIKQMQENQNQATKEIETHEITAENAFEAARNAVFFTKEGKKNVYIAAKINEYQARLRKDCYFWLEKMYTTLQSQMEDEWSRVYNRFTEILHEIRRVTQKNAETLHKNNHENPGNEYGWHIVEIPEIAHEINGAIQKAGKDNLAKDFFTAMQNNSSRWLDENTPDITEALADFLFTQFNDITTRSLEDYLHMRYGADRNVEDMIEADIAPRLHRDAVPVFHLDNAAGLYHFPSYGLVSVPTNTPAILRGIESYQANSLAGLKFNIRRSKTTDRIFWLNTQNGIPLFAYTPLRVYETLYERTINGREGVGRHLVMGEGENWLHLPSPLPQSLWGETYENTRQKTANERAEAIFYTALQTGSITCREEMSNSRYTAVLRENFDPTPFAFNKDTDPNTLHALTQQLQSLQKNGLPITEKLPLFNSATEAAALAHFLRYPKLVEAIRVENEKHQAIHQLLQKINQLQAEREQEKTDADDFLTALASETLVKQNGAYVYNNDLNEERWPELVNLLDYPDHPEYRLFTTFGNLTPEKRERLKNRAKNNRESFSEGKLLLNLRKWQGIFGTRKTEMDNNYNPADAVHYRFYHNLLQRAGTHIAALS